MGLDEIAAGHQLQSLHNTTIAWLGSANLFPIPWHESASHISLSNKLLFQGKNPEVKDKIIMNCGRIVSLSLVLFCNILLSRSFAIGFLQWQNFAIQRSLNIILEYNRVHTLSNLSFLQKKKRISSVCGQWHQPRPISLFPPT